MDLAAGGSGEGTTGERQMLIYVLGGKLEVETGGSQEGEHRFEQGGFIYLPPGTSYRVGAGEATGLGDGEPAASLLIFDKAYQTLPGVATPGILAGRERDVVGAPFLGDPSAMLQVLLPDTLAFDMAVNVFKYAPGATLPFVETHIMEHGLLMLAGEGIYRLEDSWYPVRAGDAIWMAPYCPQWFVATGKAPASYIYYKDVNRWPG